LRSTLARLCRLLTKSPALETVAKPAPQDSDPAHVVSDPDMAPVVPHA